VHVWAASCKGNATVCSRQFSALNFRNLLQFTACTVSRLQLAVGRLRCDTSARLGGVLQG
jgi:hypothetical protein